MPAQNLDTPLPGFDFSREKRLLNAGQYQAVFDQSRYKVGHSQLLLLATPNSLDHPRLGLVIAKKNVRRAVDRNKVKRMARDVFRLHQHQLGAVDIVLLARRGLGELDRPALQKLYRETFRRLSRKVAQSSEGKGDNPKRGQGNG